MENNELNNYQELIEQGLNALTDTALFQQILRESATVLRLTDTDLAVEMQMDRSTINRWRTGANAPNPIMRRSVYTWLKRRTKQAIKVFEKHNLEPVAQPKNKPAAAAIESH